MTTAAGTVTRRGKEAQFFLVADIAGRSRQIVAGVEFVHGVGIEGNVSIYTDGLREVVPPGETRTFVRPDATEIKIIHEEIPQPFG